MKRFLLLVCGLFLISTVILTCKLHAQSCGFDELEQLPLTQVGGINITSTGTVKALLIFVDFSDDDQDTANSTWPVGIGPNYLTQIVDTTETQNSGIHANITTFFKDMSFSQFTMIGKAYYQPARHPLSWYQTNYPGAEAAWSTKHAIEDLDAQVDFSDFDRWIYNGPYDHTSGQDGNLDAVFVCFRKWYICPGQLYGCSFIAQGWYGMSLPNGSVSVDNGARHIISSQGVHVTEMEQYPRHEVLLHEFGHIWGLPHNSAGGLWTLMGHRNRTISSFMNSFEREVLGWMTFTDVTVNGTNVTIGDFGTDAVHGCCRLSCAH